MFDLRSFGLVDLLQCSNHLQRLSEGASSMEEAARAVVRYLYGSLVDKETDQAALALVRLYKTHRYDELEADLQAFARRLSPERTVEPGAPCLTLLATAGDEPAWNDRRSSQGHQAIPLHDPTAIAALPMISQLTRQLGFDEEHVVHPHPGLFQHSAGRPGGVFYVPEARGSYEVPDQEDFVERHGIRSVVGFGGVLPSGYVFAVVLFAKVTIPPEVAESFAALTVATQLALLPFVERRLFDSDPPDPAPDMARDLRMARAEATTLAHLLEVRHRIVIDQAAKLEAARSEAEERADALSRSRHDLQVSEATKAAILDAALDAMITMGLDGRIVDFNPAAERTFGYTRHEAIGRTLADLIVPPQFREAHEHGLDRYRRTGDGPILGERVEITAVRADGSEFPVELTVAAVEAAGIRLFGGHVRDITGRLAAEAELRTAGERYAEIARTLQRSLLPRELPLVPGVDLAAVYRPGQDGLDVGGDFYDVFQVDDTRWGVVLGDVMGKGAEAAATTALARNTIKTAGLRGEDVTTVLRRLNEAVHRYHPDRFCTAVFGWVDASGPVVSLTLAAGGHPPPMLRTAEGVTELDVRGPLLGPFASWDGTSRTVALGPDELLLLYTDGITEARRGRELYGSDRLQAALEGTVGLTAEDTLDAVLADVMGFSAVAGDDIAAVALRAVP